MLRLSYVRHLFSTNYTYVHQSDTLLVVNTLRKDAVSTAISPLNINKHPLPREQWHWTWYDPHSSGLRSCTPAPTPAHPFYHLNVVRRLYSAVLEGHLPLHPIHCRASISKCKQTGLYKLADELHLGYPCYSLFLPVVHTMYEGSEVTYCEIWDITGTPYQCRLHALSLGHRIVGEQTFNLLPHEDVVLPPRIPSDVLLLHCWKLRYVGGGGECVEVVGEDELYGMLEAPLDKEEGSSALMLPLNDEVDDKQISIIPHQSFFHSVDSTNWRNHLDVLMKRGGVDNDGVMDDVGKAVRDEQEMMFIHQVFQKLGDNYIEWDKI